MKGKFANRRSHINAFILEDKLRRVSLKDHQKKETEKTRKIGKKKNKKETD
jgi:hypothetical protein